MDYKSQGTRLAEAFFALGDKKGETCSRVQFKIGQYPDHETDNGGMCLAASAEFFDRWLEKERGKNNLAELNGLIFHLRDVGKREDADRVALLVDKFEAAGEKAKEIRQLMDLGLHAGDKFDELEAALGVCDG